jgi:hypothetical protein
MLYRGDDEPVTVDGPGAEARARALGYGQRGAADPVAFRHFSEEPLPLYEPEPFPMWLGGIIVNNAAEAAAQRAKMEAGPAPEPEAPPPPVVDEQLYAKFVAFQQAQKAAASKPAKPVAKQPLSEAERAEIEAVEAAERAA